MRPRTPAATVADLAGTWRVAAVYSTQSRSEEFLWFGGSPLGVTFHADHVEVVTPCRVCRSPVQYEDDEVVEVGSPGCEPLVCGDPTFEFASSLPIATLQGQLAATWTTGPAPNTRGVELTSRGGRLLLER